MNQFNLWILSSVKMYLRNHQISCFLDILDQATYELSNESEDLIFKNINSIKYEDFIAKIKPATDEQIHLIENKCEAIQNMLLRNNLNHKERTALLFIYMKLGSVGEQRLWEILKQQKNYNYNICKGQIENYKKRGKFKGISCEKLKEWGVCKYECN